MLLWHAYIIGWVIDKVGPCVLKADKTLSWGGKGLFLAMSHKNKVATPPIGAEPSRSSGWGVTMQKGFPIVLCSEASPVVDRVGP